MRCRDGVARLSAGIVKISMEELERNDALISAALVLSQYTQHPIINQWITWAGVPTRTLERFHRALTPFAEDLI